MALDLSKIDNLTNALLLIVNKLVRLAIPIVLLMIVLDVVVGTNFGVLQRVSVMTTLTIKQVLGLGIIVAFLHKAVIR